jgi:hypothetical protein
MQHDSRLSWSTVCHLALALSLAALSAAVHAQQRSIPIPASSASPGGVAAASAASVDALNALPIQNQGGYGASWTTLFPGQRKCVPSYGAGGLLWYDNALCATINTDGTVTLAGARNGWVLAQLAAPHELNPLAHSAYDSGSDYSQSRTFYWHLFPARDGRLNVQVRGETPNGWVLQFRDQNGAVYSSW